MINKKSDMDNIHALAGEAMSLAPALIDERTHRLYQILKEIRGISNEYEAKH